MKSFVATLAFCIVGTVLGDGSVEPAPAAQDT